MSTRRVLVLVGSVVALAFPAAARADVVTEWNATANTSLFNVAGQPPNVGVLHLAMVQGAVFDAVNAIDRSHQPYLYTTPAPPFASKEAAAATAAYRVLVSIVPAQRVALQEKYLTSLAGIPFFQMILGAMAGNGAADAMLRARAGDGRFGTPGFPVGTGPGQWRPVLPAFANDPAGWVRNVKPFVLESPSQFRAAPPFPLTSAAYTAEFEQVKSLGSATSTTRTAFQTNSARYWAENGLRTWHRIARALAAQEGLTIEENARLFALLSLAEADTLINVWDDKAFYGFWRPITAIREAGSDGNDATAPDDKWLPLIATPPYPDHTSGASGLAGATVRILQIIFGTDNMAWTDTNLGGQTRSFTTFSDAETEVVNARMWSGIHFLRADVLGALVGTNVANWTAANYLQPVS